MIELRPYQTDMLDRLRARMAMADAVIAQSPTGSGKTAMFCEITRLAREKGKRVLILLPRRELVFQTKEALARIGILAGVIMAGETMRPAPVMLASVATLYSRAFRDEQKMERPPADLLIVDEAHLSASDTQRAIISHYAREAKVLGFTATPARKSGRGLGDIYDDLICGVSVAELTRLGYLAPAVYYAPATADLERLQVRGGDYTEKSLGEIAEEPALVGDVITNWSRLASDRKTVVFAINRAHGRALCQRFREIGVAAEYLDGETGKEERAAILRRLHAGQTQVIVNVFVLTYGWDEPSLSCAVIARPTKSIVMYLQMVGRVLRVTEGKTDAMVIDHGGVVAELGYADDEFAWTLEDGKKVERTTRTKDSIEEKSITCGDCGFVFCKTRKCPNCGHEHVSQQEWDAQIVDAELIEVSKQKKAEKATWTRERKQQFYSELIAMQQEGGQKRGWVAHKYRERVGVWPQGLEWVSRPPSLETRAWIKSRRIAWAKSKHNQQRKAA